MRPLYARNIIIASVGVLLVCSVIVVGLYFFFGRSLEQVAPLTQAIEELPLVEIGEDITDAEYAELQSLMERTAFTQPLVMRDSLRAYDIDGDGDRDIIGFMLLTFGPDSSDVLLSTWFGTPDGYVYMKDGYKDLRTEKEERCSIIGFAPLHISLSCQIPGTQEMNRMEVLYQDLEQGGYYTDFAAQARVFVDPGNWKTYESKYGGVSFRHAPDVQISEKVYDVGEDPIVVIKGTRGAEIIFEIHRIEGFQGQGSGLVDNSSHIRVLKRPDDSYLLRWLGTSVYDSSKRPTYIPLTVNQTNNVGSVFASFDTRNISHDGAYTLRAGSNAPAVLAEADNVFASLTYTLPVVLPSDVAIQTPVTPVSFADTIRISVPGTMFDVSNGLETSDGTALAKKSYDFALIDSTEYEKIHLTMSLHPYTSVGGLHAIGGGGFNAEENTCFGQSSYGASEPVSVPFKTVGDFQACSFGWGDAGISGTGRYLIDPAKQYIVSVVFDTSYGGLESLRVDYDTIFNSIVRLR